jgi:DNA-binding phage protein
MSSLKSDEYDPDELLQQAARMVVDDHKELRAVARSLGVNEEHLGTAVWYLKENRQQEARSRRQETQPEMRRKSGQDVDIKRAARELRITEGYLRNLMDMADDEKRNWQAAELARRRRVKAEDVARILGIRKETLYSYVAMLGNSRLMEEYSESRRPPHFLEEGPS